jgi:hypothetical protein
MRLHHLSELALTRPSRAPTLTTICRFEGAVMKPQLVISIQRMVCTGCGAEANASCNCGVAYQPKSIRAAEAIRANPEKSDRAIAVELGIDHKTVAKARDATGECSPVTRIGLDGKTRRLPVRDIEPEDDDIEADIEPDNYLTAYLLRADQARMFASYSGPVTKDIIAMARQVATAWLNLAKQMEKVRSCGRGRA